MVLNKIFKPLISSLSKDKWQSRDPEIRKKAIQELPVNEQETLYKIAMADPEETIRILAASRLSDLDILQTLIMKGNPESVKAAAENKFYQLLSGLKHPVPEYEVREKIIRGSRNPSLLEFVAANADRAELREITIKRINRDPLLGDIALTDTNAQVRQLAATQIAKRSTLERVAKNSRRKDKRVYKIVKTKLDRIIEDEQRPALLAAEVLEVCDKLEKLNNRNRLLQEKPTYENYLSRWDEIQNFANDEVKTRFQSICDIINSRLDKLEQQQENEKEIISKLEILLLDLSRTVDELLILRDTNDCDDKAIEQKEKDINELGRTWDETIKDITDANFVSQYNNKFQAILDLAEPHDNEQKHIDVNKISRLVDQAQNLLEQKGYIPDKTVSALESKFIQQAELNPSPELDSVTERFNQIITSLKQQIATQQQSAEKFTAQIKDSIKQINNLVDEGQVSKADKTLHDLFKKIDHSECLSSHDKHNYHVKLHEIQSQLGDLSSWRNWAHDKERENLILRAEKLLAQAQSSTRLEHEYTDITSGIKELRKQWKKLRSRTADETWQRFNNVCNEAYKKCNPYIDKQTEIRRLNLLAKQALCEQLENYIETMGWPTTDDSDIDLALNWIQVDKIVKQARKEWSEIGFVDRKEHKAITRRFDHSIEIILSELKKVWHINQQQFNDLIHKVQTLTETLDNDLQGAIHQAKEYQKQWKKIGPVSSFQRNKLWKKFRKACDIIFEKRQENIEQKNQHNAEILREKEAICENLEALNQQPLNRKDLEKAFLDIRNLWNELEPKIKSLSKEVNQRYKIAEQSYHRKINLLINNEQLHQLEIIRQKADLCTQLENTDNTTDAVIEDFRSQWHAIESLPSTLELLLQKRFEQALENINKDKNTLIEQEIINKRHFCLKSEILLGKESPENEQQLRMETQVELLNSNLGHHPGEELDIEHISDFDLQLQWFEFSNYSQDQELEERFNQLLTQD